MTQITKEAETAAVLALAQANIPVDVQALLVAGSLRSEIAPGALLKALEAALSTLPIAGEAPEGWKLVPKEPTEAMLDVYWRQAGESKEMRARTHHHSRHRYAELLAAAPVPPSSPGKDGGQEVEAVEWQGRYWIEDEGRWSNWITNPVGYRWAHEPQEGKSEIRYLYPQPASTALVERLTSALQPFAQAADDIERTYGNDLPEWQIQFPQLPMSDFRRARSALSSSQSTSREGER